MMYKRVSSNIELEQILSLQKSNLPESISPEERIKEGFVTVRHDLDLLSKMNDLCPHIIAKNNDLVVGYALCMHPNFRNDIDVLKPMFVELDRLAIIDNFVIMGQICIDKSFRKQGIFRNLYNKMLSSIKPEFSIIITEVDSSNLPSLNAHYAIGFEKLSVYQSGGQNWELISLQ